MARIEWPRSTLWMASAVLLLGSGYVQGRLSGRWSTSTELTSAVSRLDLLPRELGTWIGEDGEVDLATLHRVGIADGRVRRYRNSSDGSMLTVMLVCGRPGPVSVHTPDVCYAGAGYRIDTPPAEAIPGFLAATMERPGPSGTEFLQVHWSWNARGRWEVTSNPRIVFGAQPYLFKLYVIRSVTSATEPLDSGPAVEFARALTARFNPTPTATPAPTGTGSSP